MMFNRFLRTGTLALVAGTVFALGACDVQDEPVSIDGDLPTVDVADTDLSLVLSDDQARPGERVVVAISHDGAKDELLALQGTLSYDAAKLSFVGQVPVADLPLLVNPLEDGRLPLATYSTEGLEGVIGAVAFEVEAVDYADDLRFVTQHAVGGEFGMTPVRIRDAVLPRVDAGLPTPTGARYLDWTDWAERIGQPNSSIHTEVAASPGEYVQDLRFGDCNLDGNLFSADALCVAQVAVGNWGLIVGSDGSLAPAGGPNQDAAVAGNVLPFNSPGLGEASDDLPPGVDPDGNRRITSPDALQIAFEASGTDRPVVGEPIPGRGARPTTRQAIATCTTPGSGSAIITGTVTLTNDVIWEANCQIIVGDEAGGVSGNLVIEEGARIEGIQGSAIVVTRLGTIEARGTLLEPIVMTSTTDVASGSPNKGDWGGLLITGNARLPEGETGGPTWPTHSRISDGGSYCPQFQKLAEGGTGTWYGGCNDADNSGVLNYVEIKYAGAPTGTANDELNCLTLAAVGSGTEIDHIHCHAGFDDGVELFGGTVNLSHIYVSYQADDAFDYSFGWRGTTQFLIIEQDPADSNRGFEVDGTENSATYNNVPRTEGLVFNVTYAGKGNVGETEVFKFRRGARPVVRNAYVVDSEVGLDIDEPASCVNLGKVVDEFEAGIELTHSIFADVTLIGDPDTNEQAGGLCPAAFPDPEADYLNSTAANNTVLASHNLVAPFNFPLADFRPLAATLGATPPATIRVPDFRNAVNETTVPVDSVTIDTGFDTSASYIGAVNPDGLPWNVGWVTF